MARVVSEVPWDLNAVDLYWFNANATGSLLQTSGFIFDGQVYPDLFTVQASDGSTSLELDFLGSGITQDLLGNVTGGTVNVVLEFDVSTTSELWSLEGISTSAVDMYNAALTASNQDEINLIQTALAGNDTIIGSLANDTITGFSGSDTLTGGGGNDIFLDTKSGHNGDTITDFHPGDGIVFSDAALNGFTFTISGNTLTYSGGSMTLDGLVHGKFTATAAAAGGVELSERHLATNDFNGDGRSDIFFVNPTANANGPEITDWLSNPDGSFTSNNANLSGWVNSAWSIAAMGDFNGDGITDLLWRNTTDGTIQDWLGKSNGGTQGSNISSWTSAADMSWQIVASGDFNGDGISDLLFRNAGGYLTDWLGSSTGVFASNQANAGNGSADNSWQVAGIGDFNGDGRSDILWRNASSGYITEWLGTAIGGFVSNEANAGNGAADNSWTVVGTGDFNGDGVADILWRNATSGYVTEWLGTANGGFVSNQANAGTGAADNSWTIAQVGDFNGDGNSDILWRNQTSGYITEWVGGASGGFTSNQSIAGTGAADNSWHVLDFFG